MKRLALLSIIIATIVIGSATATPGRAAGPINWSDCGRGFECGTLQVPVDYSKPNGATLSLALVRQPATDKAHRIGSLLVNPGGPGASGVDFVRAWTAVLSRDIRARFDIVGFDPRGIGQSTPIVCHDNLQALVAADPIPTTQAAWDNLAKQQQIFNAACAKKYGDILPFLGTKNVARDMDQMRAALGDDKLNYLGYSYGTVIGQVYADMFPTKIRSMVLDGAVDLSLGPDDKTLTQIGGFELALNNFAADCRAKGCQLTKRGDPIAVIEQLIAKVKEAPIPARFGDRPAGPGETFLALITPLYSKASWLTLALEVDTALNGDATLLIRIADQYLDRQNDGSYSNSLEANIAVNCIDDGPSSLPTRFSDFPAVAATFAKVSPHFGPAVATGLSCVGWAAPADRLHPTSADGAPPIVVVDTTGDPATPYAWGVNVSKQMKSAVLLTFNGDGHTAYASGDSCIADAVNTYLLELKPPARGTECGSKVVTPPAAGTPTPTAPATGESPGDDPTEDAPRSAGDTTSDGVRWGVVAVFWVVAMGAIGFAFKKQR